MKTILYWKRGLKILLKMALLIFDVDGVLGDFTKLKRLRDIEHIQAVAGRNNLSLPEAEKLFFENREKLAVLGKPSTMETLVHLGITKEDFFKIMDSVSVKGNIIINHFARETVEKLSKKHLLVALTNTPLFASTETLKELELYGFFNKIYTPDRYDYIKPSTKIFQIILHDFSQRPAYSIGDSIEKDLVPAKTAGVKTIFFSIRGLETRVEVDFVIKDLRELLEVII